MRPLLALCMIVKDEVASIRRTLESVAGVVDHVSILDTGSTDGTQAAILSCAHMFGGHVKVLEEPFVAFDKITSRRIIDYAATRNRVLELESLRQNPAVFTLMLSGDEQLIGGSALREFLVEKVNGEQDAYCVDMHTGSISWPYPRVLRTDAGRRYVHPIHEVPVGKGGETGGPLIPGVHVTHSAADKARLYQRMREVDVPVLEYLSEAPGTSHEDHASRARAIMFLGMTHEQLAEQFPRDPGGPWLTHQMLAMSYYWRRSELEGDPEDAHYSIFHYLNIAEKIGFYNNEELLARLQPLAALDRRRPEVWYMIAANSAAVDPRKGIFFALEAAKVAREARINPLKLPSDSRVEWLAYRVAAECAKMLKNPAKVKSMAEHGIAAGGPKEIFDGYLQGAN